MKKIVNIISVMVVGLLLFNCKKESKFDGPKIVADKNTSHTGEYILEDCKTINRMVVYGYDEPWKASFAPQLLKDNTLKDSSYVKFREVFAVNWQWDDNGTMRWADLVGDADFKAENYQSKKYFDFGFSDSSNTNKYFNLKVQGDTNSLDIPLMILQLHSDTPVPNTIYSWSVSVNWAGWENISIPFSSFTNENNIAITDINKISMITLRMIGSSKHKKDLGAAYSVLQSINVDYIVITNNKIYNE